MIPGLSWFTPKALACALGALLVGACVYAAYSYVDALSERLTMSQTSLAHEQIARTIADARADEIAQQHEAALARLERLNEANRLAQAEIGALKARIDRLNLETAHDDADGAAARLNAAARNLNRLLDRAGRGARDGGGGTAGGAAARPPGAADRP